MNPKFSVALSGIFLIATLNACKPSLTAVKPGIGATPGPTAESQDKAILYYTCSMHPFIHQDHPGNCPICGMKLVPKYREGETKEQDTSHAHGRSDVRLSQEKRQLIGVKIETARIQPLMRDIHASGRVAYDPDLYVAQNDYLLSRRTGGGSLGGLQGSLIKAARDRLILLGMSEAEIRDLEKKGRAQTTFVVPSKGQELWIYGSLFEQDLPFVHAGTPVQVVIPGSDETLESHVESIAPIFESGTRSAKFRLKVQSQDLKPDMFVQLNIQASGAPVLSIPTSSVLDTGREKIAYVETEPGSYEPRPIKVGRYGSGWVEVLDGIHDGEKVVTNGSFLIDSESSLRGAGN